MIKDMVAKRVNARKYLVELGRQLRPLIDEFNRASPAPLRLIMQQDQLLLLRFNIVVCRITLSAAGGFVVSEEGGRFDVFTRQHVSRSLEWLNNRVSDPLSCLYLWAAPPRRTFEALFECFMICIKERK